VKGCQRQRTEVAEFRPQVQADLVPLAVESVVLGGHSPHPVPHQGSKPHENPQPAQDQHLSKAGAASGGSAGSLCSLPGPWLCSLGFFFLFL